MGMVGRDSEEREISTGRKSNIWMFFFQRLRKGGRERQ